MRMRMGQQQHNCASVAADRCVRAFRRRPLSGGTFRASNAWAGTPVMCSTGWLLPTPAEHVGCMHSPKDSPPLPQPLSPFPFLTQLLPWQLRRTPCRATHHSPAGQIPAAACGRCCSCWIPGKMSGLTVPLAGGLAAVCCCSSAPGSSCVQSSGAALLARLCSMQNGDNGLTSPFLCAAIGQRERVGGIGLGSFSVCAASRRQAGINQATALSANNM